MSVDRVKFQDILESQLPRYVREEFPLLPEFLKQYYLSQEVEGGTFDIVQNIDQYVKLDQIFNLSNETELFADVNYTDTTINTSVGGNFTVGFPDTNGLIQIDDEIIFYETRTDKTFEGCVRGFSGITSYISPTNPEELVFESSTTNTHKKGAKIKNLNVLFLQEFFKKIKKQVAPGFSGRSFDNDVNQRNFIINADSFYQTKGTKESFKILFKALYGENVDVINPQRFLFKPSDADYRLTKDLIVETIEGNPLDLLNQTLIQNSSGANGTVTKVEKIVSQEGNFYQLGIDIGYDRDINVRGTIYGEFKVVPKTKILNSVAVGQTVIDVDSTLGFGHTGYLMSTNSDGDPIKLNYVGKSINQFFNVEGTTYTINESESIRSDDYAYSYVGLDSSNLVKVTINSALEEFIQEDQSYLCEENDLIRVKSFGNEPTDERSQQWFTNLKTTMDVSVIGEIDVSERIYEISTFDKHFLYPGYRVVLYNNAGTTVNGTLTRITSESGFILKLESEIVTTGVGVEWKVVNQILKTETQRYPKLSEINTNILNTYSKFNGDTLVVSNSLPSYQDESIDPYNKTVVFSGSATNTFDLKLTTNTDHGFKTGDAVYYNRGVVDVTTTTPDGVTLVTQEYSGFDGLGELIYYVKRVNQQTIKLSRSRSDIFAEKYVSLLGNVENVKFTYYPNYDKKLLPQPIVREILDPDLESGDYKTEAGFYNGIFLNGVELVNYKSTDKLFYGQVESINIGSPGDGWDVINPPLVHIEDTAIVGTGATGIAAVEGELVELCVLDTGFDYLDTPVVKISGGSGKDASAEVNMTTVAHNVSFNAGVSTDIPLNTLTGGISTATNTIGFTTYHKFRDNERVIYNTRSQGGIVGLVTGSDYFVNVVDAYSIQLHNTFDDANVGINTISFTDLGYGIQDISSYERKKVVTSIVVTNPGSGYKNKQRQVPALVGVQTASDEITIINHGYETGEVVNYYSTGDDIGGLSTTQDYFVTKVDENNFKLSLVGSGTVSRNFYLDSQVYVNLETKGVGYFNYKPISVVVDGIIGVNTLTDQDFGCKVLPIFRGSLDSVDITSGGVGYGSSEILNFSRDPVIRFKNGENAKLQPIVSNGRIVDVIVITEGSEYFSTPNLILRGSGQYAKLIPITRDGRIVSVHIENAGIGYVADETTIDVIPAGRNEVAEAVLTEWTIDIVRKDLNNIPPNDVFVTQSNDNKSLQCSSPYTPRLLRRNLNALNDDGTRFFGSNDLRIENGVEVDNIRHSPIVGWSYDGVPIYGPYGFANAKKGLVKQMVSGYELNIDNPNRPSRSIYPGGFFVEDYVFTNKGDLDKHNGRFCVTPDYPNGVYAYFTTVTNIPDSSGPFKNFKSPVFPYAIGPTFKFKPNKFNLSTESNTDQYDIEKNEWFRNTDEYHLNDDRSGYDYIFDSRSESEDLIEVTATSSGGIENVGILTGGVNYQVNDRVRFNNERTNGKDAQARVERVLGKEIKYVDTSVTSIENVEFITSGNPQQFIGFSTTPNNLEARDVVQIDGLSTYYKGFDGAYTVGIRSDNWVLTLGVSTTGVTGVTTYFYVSGGLQFPYIRSNDILGIGTERVKVLNVEPQSSRIRVLRAQDGTVGVAHSNRTVLQEDPRKFTINTVGVITDRKTNLNTEIYFVSGESVGIGTTTGLGVGTTVSLNDPGIGATQRFLEPQTIYLPGHQLNVNDQLIYKNHGNTSIQSWNGVDSSYHNLSEYETFYAAPLTVDTIGIATNKVGFTTSGYVGINSAPGLLFFTNSGNGDYHSFETILDDVVRAQVSKSTVTVSTAQTHGLKKDNIIHLSVKPYDVKTVVVKYSDFNRRFVFDPVNFVGGDVDTVRDLITITDHNFTSGDKVIYTSSSVVGGLENEGMYYVVPYDRNRIRLVDDKYKVDLLSPTFVNLTSTGTGTLSKINPLVIIKRNQKLKFDLSDTTLSFEANGNQYSGFEMNLYSDLDFVNEFVTSGKTEEFEVTRSGRAGLDSDANLTLFVSDNIPQNLWYNFERKNLDILKDSKRGYEMDLDSPSHNQIFITHTKYDGKHIVSGVGSTTFSFNLPSIPDVLSYDQGTANSIYETSSRSEKGRITKIEVLNPGYGYKSLPGVSNVRSDSGSGAILYTESESVGKILTTKYVSGKIGYGMPSDETLKVVSNIPQILDVETLASFDYIGITSNGRNYLIAPDLVVLDGYTNEVVPEIKIKYNLGDSRVTIFTNTYNLHFTEPRIIPTNNSNGVGINSAVYDPVNKTAQIFFSQTFSEAQNFPFKVNDEILVENTSVGVNSTGSGYNSSDYSYKFFKVVEIDPNIGGANGSLKYDMSDVIDEGDVPGNYDIANSIGKAVPVTSFPIFDASISKNDFSVGEKVVTGSTYGFIESWNPVTEVARVSSPGTFNPGDKLVAETSGTVSFVGEVTQFDSQIITGAGTTIVNGWQRDTGFLNDNLQVLPNNEYYQNFSYSISSRVPLDSWEDSVSAINHPSGFQKFSDLQIESFVEDNRSNPYGIDSEVEIVVDVISESNIHCFHDFDDVSERTSIINNESLSKEVHFENKILTDHFESIGNRVVLIDDISDNFNSETREDTFIDIANFDPSQVFNRVFTLVKDQTFTQQRQFSILSFLQFGPNASIQEYATLLSRQQLGQFDYIKKESGWQVRFFPASPKFNSYDITVCTVGLFDSNQGIGTDIYSVGSMSRVEGQSVNVSSGSTTNIVTFPVTDRSAKIRTLFSLGEYQYQSVEVNVVHDGTNVSFTKYGDMGSTSDVMYGDTNIGAIDANIVGSNVVLSFTNNVGTAVTANSSMVLTSAAATGITSTKMRTSRLTSNYVSIPSSGSPIAHSVASYADPFSAANYFITVSNTTDGTHTFHEVVVFNTDEIEQVTTFAEVETGGFIGTFGVNTDTSNTFVTFTPIANKNVQVRVIGQELLIWDGNEDLRDIDTDFVSFTNNEAIYKGTDLEQTNKFQLNSGGFGIFERSFDGSDPEVVGLGTNVVNIPNHLFESGESIIYNGNQGRNNQTTVNNIGITPTVVSGIGLTDKLPSNLFAVKVSDKAIAFAASAEDALAQSPKTFELTSVGLGTFHRVSSNSVDQRTMITIDNAIQSPITNTNVTTNLSATIQTQTNFRVAGISSFFPDDIVKVDDEFMMIISPYQDPDDGLYYFEVVRGMLSSTLAAHNSGSTVTKITGNYSIVENSINFVSSPKGKNPLSTTTSGPDNIDWVGVTTNSSFQGRVFNRTSFVGETNENYVENVVFDDISPDFTGVTSEFTLKSGGAAQLGISTDNIVTLINGVFQEPDGIQRDGRDEFPAYTLTETGGQTVIQYQADPYNGDNNTRTYPRGGILMEVGSTGGTGYQPLVAAGGTAVVSTAGTITSISIGNSGSGYRPGAQEIVNVGVQTYSNGIPSIEFIGTAAISGGHIVSVAVTNPGTGYTSTDAPTVIFDEPHSYTNVPLIYSPGYAGVGTEATVDIVVGQGSSVIDFTLNNKGSGYGDGVKLTIGVGGTVGIPTFSSHSDFEIEVVRTQRDNFNGWYVGELEVFDRLDTQFDGTAKTFNLSIGGEGVAIIARKGSNLDVKNSLLVFINNVLQEPGRAYDMQGGSVIRFNEAPKPGDTGTIYFYKGTRDKDVVFQDILETVKEGDTLNIDNNPTLGQSQGLDQDDRIVVGINTLDSVRTTPYINPGVTTDTTLLRPVAWCKQLTDVIIDGEYVGKDRMHYEPNIFPFSYLIKSIGFTTTILYVDSVKPLFDSLNETEDSKYQGKLQIVSQDTKEAGFATAIINEFGELDSVVLTNPGAGYTAVPDVSISFPETGERAFAEAVNQLDKIVSFNVVEPGFGYTSTNPPIVHVAPPNYPIEIVQATDYSGDYGIIVGLGTLTSGQTTQIVFDFFIPYDSFMRNGDLTSDSTATSGINTGDFFTVFNSKTQYSRGTVVSLETDDSTRIGVTTDSLDNIYQVANVQTQSVNVAGVGVTNVRRVFSNIVGVSSDSVSFDNTSTKFDSTAYTMDRVNYEVFSGGIGTSFNFGEFSWGKINVNGRPDAQPFNSHTGNGYSGINTSAYVRRFNQLKFKNYDVIDY